MLIELGNQVQQGVFSLCNLAKLFWVIISLRGQKKESEISSNGWLLVGYHQLKQFLLCYLHLLHFDQKWVLVRFQRPRRLSFNMLAFSGCSNRVVIIAMIIANCFDKWLLKITKSLWRLRLAVLGVGQGGYNR